MTAKSIFKLDAWGLSTASIKYFHRRLDSYSVFIFDSSLLSNSRACNIVQNKLPAYNHGGLGSCPGQSMYMKFVVDKGTRGQIFLRVLGFPLSVLFYSSSIFTHISGGWTKGPLKAQIHKDKSQSIATMKGQFHNIIGSLIAILISTYFSTILK
jgi:hypothetical protein